MPITPCGRGSARASFIGQRSNLGGSSSVGWRLALVKYRGTSFRMCMKHVEHLHVPLCSESYLAKNVGLNCAALLDYHYLQQDQTFKLHARDQERSYLNVRLSVPRNQQLNVRVRVHLRSIVWQRCDSISFARSLKSAFFAEFAVFIGVLSSPSFSKAVW